MRKYLLPEKGSFYKANLHCHSTISDGKWTPEQIRENYKSHGYSIVAYTDHEVFVTHNDLRQPDFLPLNGYEMSFVEEGPLSQNRKCHICLISLDENKKTQKLIRDCKYIEKNKETLQVDKNAEYTSLLYDMGYISDIMKKARAEGFFVTYNHPVWSFETKNEYCNYHGMHAMEIINYDCIVGGYDDRNGNIYDQMLRNGEEIYCIATDDNHNKYPIGHPKCDSFGGFTMIKAENLTYESIAEALLKGNFYSSEGPEIKELYFEDNKIYIETSAAAKIIMSTKNRHYKSVTAEIQGQTISGACFDIDTKVGAYVRFTVVDEKGRQANTNACFLSSLT